ncbi:MAG: signal peptidase II [Paludibacteraceae bacterium]|nr:signal peptidase II [Paludibacteraceae bacterium]
MIATIKNKTILVTAIILLAVVIDQVIKLSIAGHFALGESHEITSWFWLCYIENNGMAFGLEWMPKIVLTLFRMVAVVLLGWYIHKLIRRQETPIGYIVTIAFVIAGALGNIIDCVFYGKLLQGGEWFYGKVIDMFYFPLIHNSAGEVLFFKPVFNFADSCITVSVFVILFFYSKQLNLDSKKEDPTPEKGE